MPHEMQSILHQFPATESCAAEPKLFAVDSGFSGAQVWRLECAARQWAARRWPENSRAERLAWIQNILLNLPESIPIPKPLLSHSGHAFLEFDRFFWTIEPWLPGQADYWYQPSEKKLTAAMHALAQFHRATSRWATGPQPIPSITERVDALRQHAESLMIYATSIPDAQDELASLGRELLTLAREQLPTWLSALSPLIDVETMLIPCIRDIWHDHILFTGGQVTGLIDFGAMRMDSIAVDLARLIGSLVGDNLLLRKLAVEAYCAANPFNPSDLRLVDLIDGSSQVIAGLNWIRWLYVENRTFDHPARVHERMRNILNRLKRGRLSVI